MSCTSHHRRAADRVDAYKMITRADAPAGLRAAPQRLGLRHETPQAILLRDGKVVWNASHFSITATQLDQALASLAAESPKPSLSLSTEATATPRL